MHKYLTSVSSMILISCTNSQDVRFHHPQYGVVNGEHDQLKADSINCFQDSEDINNPNAIEKTAATVGEVNEALGEEEAVTITDAIEATPKGIRLVKHQSKCMSAKGWRRVE